MGSPGHLQLSVILPCFNEATHIGELLQLWLEFLKNQNIAFELIAINDGSLDGTGRVLDRIRKEFSEIRVVHQLNLGTPRAIRRGIEMARGKYVLLVDATGRFAPDDFEKLWEARNEQNIVLTQRQNRKESLSQQIANYFLKKVVAWRFEMEIPDPGSPILLLHRDEAQTLLEEIPAGAEATQLLLTCLLQKRYQSRVVPISIPTRRRPIEQRIKRRRKKVLARKIRILRELLAFPIPNNA